MKRILAIALILIAVSTEPVYAYKEQIHRVISLKAWDRVNVDLNKRIGIQQATDIMGATPRTHVGQGSYDEDDIPNPLNHFYDPIHGAALSVPVLACMPLGTTAKTRAVGGVGNEYSTWAARQYLRSALLAANDSQRQIFLRALFLSLGHSIHLLQDMAQPEHTRNDQHLTLMGIEVGDAPQASIWEEWGIANLLGVNPAVSYDGYPNVGLATAGDYFSHSGNKGLAQFSNLNFVTQDTNYGDYSLTDDCYFYALPDINAAAPRTEVVNEAVRDAFGGVTVMPITERIYTSFPQDYYSGAPETDPFHTFYSSLDLETRTLPPGNDVYSLGDGSYLTRASMLIPRAVGYSAGYLDHFFRGSIDVEWKSSTNGRYIITIRNTSSEQIGADALIDVAYAPGASYLGTGGDVAMILQGPLATYVPGFAGLPPGGSVTINDVSVPYLHAGDKVMQFERRTIVRATLGSEPEDVITLVQPGGPSAPLKVLVTWNPNPWGGVYPIFVFREFDERDHLSIAHEIDHRNTVPNCTVTWDSSAREASFAVTAPLDPNGYYIESVVNGSDCSQTTTATVTWYAYGEVVHSSTQMMSPCTITYFGSYKP
jgi:hypothetical protein